jgi:hypothetical protein
MKTIVVLLDETGSMQPGKAETIQSFNKYVKDLEGEEVAFHLTLFNSTKVERRHQGVAPKDVPPLTEETYQPLYNTPLWDAIGQTIEAVGEPALMVILTDGEENASKEYKSLESIQALIEAKRKDGWEFLFLAKGLDAYNAGVLTTGALSTSPVPTSSVAMAAASLSSSDYLAGRAQRAASVYVKQATDEDNKA